MRIEKRRVVLNIPRDVKRDLQELRGLHRAWDLGVSPKETFPQWLVRFLREWVKRERRRLKRRELKWKRLKAEREAELERKREP